MTAASLTCPFDVNDSSARALRGFAIAAQRPVQIALLLSALLHAIALGWLPGLERLSFEAPLPLRILLPPVAPAVMPVVSPALPPAPLPLPRRAAAAPAAAAAPLAAQAVTAPPRGDEAAPVRTVAPTERPAAAPAFDAPPPATVAAPVVDAQALAGYGRSVAGAVAVHQRYPKIAQMRLWQGTATLQLEFAADGRLLETRVLSSSGHDVLDRQALDMVRAAQPLPPLPAALAGRALTVNVPVVFRLAG